MQSAAAMAMCKQPICSPVSKHNFTKFKKYFYIFHIYKKTMFSELSPSRPGAIRATKCHPKLTFL